MVVDFPERQEGVVEQVLRILAAVGEVSGEAQQAWIKRRVYFGEVFHFGDMIFGGPQTV